MRSSKVVKPEKKTHAAAARGGSLLMLSILSSPYAWLAWAKITIYTAKLNLLCRAYAPTHAAVR
jgi:hypothetical protein